MIPIGMDLGTTYSVVARLDQAGRPQTLFNAEGDRTTPSMVLIDEGEIIVGREALKAMADEAPRVADCAKRDIGRRAFRRPIDDEEYPPEVLEAFILDKLRRDAVEQVGPFTHAVITVPAYFDEVRRKATQDAGYMAGLDVLDIINEPTAAALSYAYEHGGFRAEDDTPRRFLVYDLGGGTFDVTVMEIRGNRFTTLATDGDVELGGRDWDYRLLDIVAERFHAAFDVDPRDDPIAVGRLWHGCEEAKRTLSIRDRASIHCDYAGHAARYEITLDEFETATADLLERTRFTCQQTLAAAGLDWSRIDTVLLVGGSTRMPMVGRMVRELTGVEPNTGVSADEAVAHGAALHAGALLAKQRGERPAFSIKNVNSHSLGVVGVDPLTRRPRNGVLIPRNTPLPARAKRTFRTQREGQRSILVQIIEGESSSPDDCTPLGRCAVRDLPEGLPARCDVDVYFEYAASGRLSVRVMVPSMSAEASTEIVRQCGLDFETLDQWRERISGS